MHNNTIIRQVVDVNVNLFYLALHGESMQQQLWTISELAGEFCVSTRTIRFYEDKELLHPQRVGSNRVYNYQDRARLKLILRGKRLGFSLEEIKDYIELYRTEVDPAKTQQVNYLLEGVRDKIKTLRKQQEDLTTTLAELANIEAQCLDELNKAHKK